MVRQVGAATGVVASLHLPHDDPVLDKDIPRARPRAIYTVSGADFLIGPAIFCGKNPPRTAHRSAPLPNLRQHFPCGSVEVYFQVEGSSGTT